MIPLTTPWPAIAGAILCLGVGFASGYALKGRLDDGKIARAEAAVSACRFEAAEAQRRAALEAAALKTRAETAQAQAAAEMSRREAAFRRRLKEVKSEIYSLSNGRECLSGDLRLRLNASLAGDGLSQGAAPAAPAAAAAAADPGGSSDAAVGQWIVDAASLYEQCRARIDAIRRWDELTHAK
jgi:hypothetical protein